MLGEVVRWETVLLGSSVRNGIDTGDARRNQFQDKPLSGSKRNDISISKRWTDSFSKLFPVLCLVERREASTLSTPLLGMCLKVLFYCNFLINETSDYYKLRAERLSCAVDLVGNWEKDASTHPSGLWGTAASFLWVCEGDTVIFFKADTVILLVSCGSRGKLQNPGWKDHQA